MVDGVIFIVFDFGLLISKLNLHEPPSAVGNNACPWFDCASARARMAMRQMTIAANLLFIASLLPLFFLVLLLFFFFEGLATEISTVDFNFLYFDSFNHVGTLV